MRSSAAQSRPLSAIAITMDCRGWINRSAAASGSRDGTAESRLRGLAFSAKDCFDVSGYKTGLGNPSWQADHPPAVKTAPAIQALLDAGANLAGKAAMSELAYDFSGENCFYGAPLNVAAPGRMAGGSSGGSAVLVAAGEVAFSLGGDTAGSVRVPSSFSGVFGCRPTHGRISLEGVAPLAPSFDTVGWFARDAQLLTAVGKALLGTSNTAQSSSSSLSGPWKLLVPEDVLALCDDEVAQHFQSELVGLHGPTLAAAAGGGQEAPSPVVLGDQSAGELASWAAAFGTLHSKEVWGVLGPWFTGPTQPVVSAPIAQRLKQTSTVTEAQAAEAQQQALGIAARLASVLGDHSVLLMPTTPFPAPPVGFSLEGDATAVQRLLAINAISSICGLPQVCMPLLKLPSGLPLGVSIIGPRGSDEALLALAEKLTAIVTTEAPAAQNGVHFTPPVCAEMLPPGLDDPKVWRLRFIITSTLAPGKTMKDHADNLKDHHAYLQDLCNRGLLQFMGPFLTPDAHDCGDGMFCLRASNTAEAHAIVAQNPFHQRGIRTFVIRPWLEKILD